jgi:hypothetical protein
MEERAMQRAFGAKFEDYRRKHWAAVSPLI